MSRRAKPDLPFTRREWLHLVGATEGDWGAYVALLLLGAMYFCSDPLGDALLAGGAVVASFVSLFLGWRHEPECSDACNAMILLMYPPVPIITVLVVAVSYL